MANIQISEELFLDLLRYHLWNDQSELNTLRIQKGLNTKLDAMTRRQLYTDSKTAPSDTAREIARQAYLDKAGISKDFRK